MSEAERIEIGGEMPAHTVCPHKHHCANRIACRSNGVGLCHGFARSLGRSLHFDRHLRGVERCRQIVSC